MSDGAPNIMRDVHNSLAQSQRIGFAESCLGTNLAWVRQSMFLVVSNVMTLVDLSRKELIFLNIA